MVEGEDNGNRCGNMISGGTSCGSGRRERRVEEIILENEKCRATGVVLSDHQWEKIIDFFSKPVVEGGMELPT